MSTPEETTNAAISHPEESDAAQRLRSAFAHIGLPVTISESANLLELHRDDTDESPTLPSQGQ